MTYEEIHLLTEEDLPYFVEKNRDWKDYEIIPGLYISPGNRLQDLVKAIKLDERGAYDFAIPQKMWEQYGDHKGLGRAIWFYPHKGETGHIFGKPLTLREILAEFKVIVQKAIVDFFVHDYPW